MHAGHTSDDIHNRIQRPHLMEMNLLNRRPMHFRLRIGQAQKYRDGLDEGAVLGMLESYGVSISGEGGNAMTARAQGAFMTQTVVGSPVTCAAKIEAFLRDCNIDGLMFIYDDYLQGLRVTGEQILPQLRKAFA